MARYLIWRKDGETEANGVVFEGIYADDAVEDWAERADSDSGGEAFTQCLGDSTTVMVKSLDEPGQPIVEVGVYAESSISYYANVTNYDPN